MRDTSRRRFLVAIVFLLGVACSYSLSTAQGTFPVEEATIESIHAAMKAGQLTSRNLVQMYLDRINAYDKKGPAVNAIIKINPDALTIAESLDEKFAKDGFVGPLHGIPVVLKDIYITGDKMPTTAGSRALEGFVAPRDGFLVKQLRNAGAIILAKANTDEWAHSSRVGYAMGYSSLIGQSLNPYKLSRTPRGSSCGPGVAIASNFAVIGMGSDTLGSLRSPSAVNGLVTIKSTHGLLSRSGIIPISLNYDMGGPMTRTVADLAVTLGVLTGPDPDDPLTFDSVGHYHKDYTKFLKADGLKGAKIGVLRIYFGSNDDIDKAMEGSIEIMRKMGATVIDPVEISNDVLSRLNDIYSATGTRDFKWHLAECLATLGPNVPVRTLPEVIVISESAVVANSKTPVDKGVIDRLRNEVKSGPLTDSFYQSMLKHGRAMVRDAVLTLLKDKNLDAIIFPAQSCPPAVLPGREDPDFKCGKGLQNQNGIASISGFPSIVAPAGFTTDGIPIGIAFLGRAYSEPTLLRIAYSYEQATKHRRPPQTVPPLK